MTSEALFDPGIAGVSMRRYCVCEAEGGPNENYSWLVLDVQANVVVRMNGVWLDMPTKAQAERFAQWLNRLDGEKQLVM